MRDGRETILNGDFTVGLSLNRMDVDGSNKEVIFEYRCPQAEQGAVCEDDLTGLKYLGGYLSFITEISGDEIVIEVYVSNEAHPVYRMNTDGSGQRLIGQIPTEK